MKSYEKAPYRMIQGLFRGAVSGNRTRTVLLPRDFKSLVSTNSTMTANFYLSYYTKYRWGLSM